MPSVHAIPVPEASLLAQFGKQSDYRDCFARGETDRFGAWEVVERKGSEILALSKDTNTASWFAIEPLDTGTRLKFGSWVGSIGESGWKALLRPHVWYSRQLLAGV